MVQLITAMIRKGKPRILARRSVELAGRNRQQVIVFRAFAQRGYITLVLQTEESPDHFCDCEIMGPELAPAYATTGIIQ